MKEDDAELVLRRKKNREHMAQKRAEIKASTSSEKSLPRSEAEKIAYDRGY